MRQELNILLVQLGSNGDCLFVTTIARQIKELDYPGCHLTWMIGSKFRQVIDNNPYVDSIYEIPITTIEELHEQRNRISQHIQNASQEIKFDKIFITDYCEENRKNWYGTTRSSLFRSYPNRLKIKAQPNIFLTDKEIQHVNLFCSKYRINKNYFNILIEASPQSNQSNMNINSAFQIANNIVKENSRIKFIISSSTKLNETNSNIIDGSGISFRENAELVNYCDLLVGCSSGISWLCTSGWSKSVPFIQIINPDWSGLFISASVINDFDFFNLSTINIIELHNPTISQLQICIESVINSGVIQTKKRFKNKITNFFLDNRLLKESYLPLLSKIGIKIKLIINYPVQFYRKNKPKWFAPSIWFASLVKKNKY